MAESVLLTLARNSIEEVLLGERKIDKTALIEENPILTQEIASYVTIYHNGVARGVSGSVFAQRSLVDDIIYNAKYAAFEDENYSPLTSSEYLHSQIRVSLITPPESIGYEGGKTALIKLLESNHGLVIQLDKHQVVLMPPIRSNFEEELNCLLAQLASLVGFDGDILDKHPLIYTFEAQHAISEPILVDNEVV